ncbi:MAG: hypothetical protein XD79_0441 [Atribacteria bacterium 34_128]|nr:MAG: hypothetical protein XD79_0441 [Atribacteria bacterium 34_128]
MVYKYLAYKKTVYSIEYRVYSKEVVARKQNPGDRIILHYI